jgi:hypothetical protein
MLIAALLLQDWLFVAVCATCVGFVVWRVVGVKLIVGPDSVTVHNPWGRTEINVGSLTEIALDATVSFAPVMTVGLGVFERAEHVVGIVASSYPTAKSVEVWVPVLRSLSDRTGCVLELPDAWTPAPWWR